MDTITDLSGPPDLIISLTYFDFEWVFNLTGPTHQQVRENVEWERYVFNFQ